MLDVVKSAVAVPEADSQDSLRVLATAVTVAAPVDGKLARQLAQQGADLEARLIAGGETPAVSVMQSGFIDCATAQQFVDVLPASASGRAQDSLVGALQACPKTLPSVERKLDEALQNGTVAPRALMAAIQAAGTKADWSQKEFEALFKSLPTENGKAQAQAATDLAGLYAQTAADMGQDLAAASGVRFLEWANTLPNGGDRSQAVNVVTGAMQDVLGKEKYAQALSSNVTAAQVAQAQGESGEADEADSDTTEESVSVLQAMDDTEDRSSEFQNLPDTLRAREAAAHGFARGSDGDLAAANRYFDMAFQAVDSAWSNREDTQDVSSLVEEVSEAAAQVDPLAALRRAQKLQEPTARAVAMLAVARVVFNRQNGLQPMVAKR